MEVYGSRVASPRRSHILQYTNKEEFMFARRNLITIALLVFALVLVACSAAPAATPQTIVVTSPPIIQTSAPVVQTVVVTVAAPQPTAAPTKPPTGQSLTVAATWGGGER